MHASPSPVITIVAAVVSLLWPVGVHTFFVIEGILLRVMLKLDIAWEQKQRPYDARGAVKVARDSQGRLAVGVL